mmetsp:Transcript_2934/g.1985  ORF Transcript_2934/g.1985 Transcript_2934/m.1985 type:complete len:157 (+) Transcript_2934:155-625(+)
MRKDTAYILHKDDMLVLGKEVVLLVEQCSEKEELKLSEFSSEVDIWPSFSQVASTPSLIVSMYYKHEDGYEYRSSHQLVNQALDLAVGSKSSKPAGQQILVQHKQTISGLHCRLFSKGGKWCAQDSNSRNGTFLSLAHHKMSPMAHGRFRLETIPD